MIQQMYNTRIIQIVRTACSIASDSSFTKKKKKEIYRFYLQNFEIFTPVTPFKILYNLISIVIRNVHETNVSPPHVQSLFGQKILSVSIYLTIVNKSLNDKNDKNERWFR